ncbi:hypothetical protein BITS_1616 [Bifidobacterium tsurumiense]|uniref:Uncharacterized protein n=1 Tax=Bifidobacterium tsurumiense TaxID=356829 RepID=A0A087EES9_9BIFI|nr:hypothetical protein BITS_1616 [Bifidobacterium tsurumiense]
MVDEDLGGDEDLFTRYPRISYCLAHGFFIAIRLRGIDKTVSCAQCLCNCLFGGIGILNLEYTESDHWHLDTVIKCYEFHCCSFRYLVISRLDPQRCPVHYPQRKVVFILRMLLIALAKSTIFKDE